jgi:hypothetical protein
VLDTRLIQSKDETATPTLHDALEVGRDAF